MGHGLSDKTSRRKALSVAIRSVAIRSVATKVCVVLGVIVTGFLSWGFTPAANRLTARGLVESTALTHGFVSGSDGSYAKNVENKNSDLVLRFEGLVYLTEAQLSQVLPLTKSGIWWRTHLATLERTLRKNALIEDAQVQPCEHLSLNCYKIHILERQPSFVAVLPDRSKAWLIGREGTFITPVSTHDFSRGEVAILATRGEDDLDRVAHTIVSLDRFPVAHGLWSNGASPDEVRMRAHAFSSLVLTLQKESHLQVQDLQFRGGEVEATVVGYSFPVLFNLNGSSDEYIDTARRLKVLLSELSGRNGKGSGTDLSNVVKVDMTSSRIAAVKLKVSPDIS